MEKSEIEGLWTHIHWLSVLEEQGTYTAAAARLGVSKSAVSQRISDLEKATGTRLVTRTTRSVRLTDAGLSLTREVRSAYEHIARSFSSVRDSAGEIRGLVRLDRTRGIRQTATGAAPVGISAAVPAGAHPAGCVRCA